MSGKNDQILSDERTTANTMKKHFVSITKKSKLIPTETEIKEFSQTVRNTKQVKRRPKHYYNPMSNE